MAAFREHSDKTLLMHRREQVKNSTEIGVLQQIFKQSKVENRKNHINEQKFRAVFPANTYFKVNYL